MGSANSRDMKVIRKKVYRQEYTRYERKSRNQRALV